MMPESVTLCNQACLPLEGDRHHTSHKQLDLQFILFAKYAVVKMPQKLWEWPHCFTWLSDKNPNGESRLRLWPCCILLVPISPTGLPYLVLIEKEVTSIIAPWYNMAGWCPRNVCLYMNKTSVWGEGRIGGEKLWRWKGGETVFG